jgi:hypothetical protein
MARVNRLCCLARIILEGLTSSSISIFGNINLANRYDMDTNSTYAQIRDSTIIKIFMGQEFVCTTVTQNLMPAVVNRNSILEFAFDAEKIYTISE